MFKNLFTKKELVAMAILAVEGFVIYKFAQRMDTELEEAINKFKEDEANVNNIFNKIDLGIETPNIKEMLLNKEDQATRPSLFGRKARENYMAFYEERKDAHLSVLKEEIPSLFNFAERSEKSGGYS